MKSFFCGVLAAFYLISAPVSGNSPQVTTSAEMLYCGMEEPEGCPVNYLATLPGVPFKKDRLEPHKPDQPLIKLNDIPDFRNLYTSHNESAPESCWLVNRPVCRDQLQQALDHYHSGSPQQEQVQLVTTANLGDDEDASLYYLIGPAFSAGGMTRVGVELFFFLIPASVFYLAGSSSYAGLSMIISAIGIFVLRLPDDKKQPNRYH